VNKIVLENEIIEPNSVKINCDCEISNWRFVEENNTIYFSQDLWKNQKYNIEYETAYQGILRSYELNIPKYRSDGADGEEFYYDYDENPVLESGKISFEGRKNIGVMFGSNGETAMNQSLDVEIYGNIDSTTTISAHISDQSSSLDGQTGEIGELDKIYIKIENPKWSAAVGDLEIRSNESGILKEFYTPKGLFAESKNDGIGRKNNAFAGISGTKFGYNKFEGVTGIQNGMFNLQPDKNHSYVKIISGGVSVSLDGKTLKEDEDYIVDYDLAGIKFTAKTPIMDGQAIEISYKYRDFDYNIFTSGTRHNFSFLDSSLLIDFSVYYDKDIWESSQRDFTPDEISQIKNSGARSPQFLLGNKIHKNDVLKTQAYKRIYRLDSTANVYYWENDPESVYLKRDLYSVNFQPSDSGEYLPYRSNYRDKFSNYTKEYLDSVENEQSAVLEPIYLFVGKGGGLYTAFGEIVLPKRSVKGEISAVYAPNDRLIINIAAAGINSDENTLSDNNEYDNSAAVKADVFVSSNSENNFLVKDRFEVYNTGDFFVNNVLNGYETFHKWGISGDIEKYMLWENIFYAGFQKSILLKGGYGQSVVDNLHFLRKIPYSRRISGGFESGKETPFYFDYLFTKRVIEDNGEDGRQQNASISFDLSRLYINFAVEETWYKSEKNDNYFGDVVSSFTVENEDKTLSGALKYRSQDVGENEKHFLAKENSWNFLISSSANRNLSANQKIKADLSLIFANNSFSMLAYVLDNIYSDDYSSGIDTKWDLTYETRSERRWEYVKVPAGTGTHIKDSVSGVFVEQPFGDYIAKDIFVYDFQNDFSLQSYIANNFEIFWYKSLKGIKLSGDFCAESKIPKGGGKWYEFMPLVANLNEKLRNSAAYSLISYNQYISIFPSEIPEISSNIRFGASKNIERQNSNAVFDEECDFLYKFSKFHIGFSNRGFWEKQENYNYYNNYNFIVKDISLKPIETIVINNFFHIFTEQTFGLTAKNGVSGNYMAVRPGIKFLPKNAGSADISYSYAFVNFDGDLFYNMTDGFSNKNNHRVQSVIGINASEKLRFSGFLRGDKNKNTREEWRISASFNAEIMIN
jgi:hypothetical protein